MDALCNGEISDIADQGIERLEELENMRFVNENQALEYEFDQYAMECQSALDLAMVRIENARRMIAADPMRNDPFDRIEGRIKAFDSTIKKCRRKDYNLDIDSIKKSVRDIAGIRIITIFRDEIEQVADLISKIPGLNVVSREDYIHTPKENGYSSLHLEVQVEIYSPDGGSKLVPIEIQIRDKSMNLWASVEHKIKYKKKDHDPKAEEYFIKLAEILSEFDEVAMQFRDYDKSGN
ncbi:hypothetical protein IJI86_01410 [Candidatus Saccharibacteria bacterium]|nr:hypothetical protein [Candidatus Saccharibacteria bacterium]